MHKIMPKELSVGCLKINKLPYSDQQQKLKITIKHLLDSMNTDITVLQELSCPQSRWLTMTQKIFRFELGHHSHFLTIRGQN